MLVAISSVEFSATAHLLFEAAEDSDIENTSRRVSRTATLDGGCLITDDGFSNADTTFNLASKDPLSEYDLAILRTLHQDHSLVVASLPTGVYKGVISRFKTVKGLASLTILAKEKLSA